LINSFQFNSVANLCSAVRRNRIGGAVAVTRCYIRRIWTWIVCMY